MSDGPLFIGGLDRSGKTALRRALEAGGRLALSRRTYLWTYFYGRYGSLAHDANLDRCLAAMRRHRPIVELGLDFARLRREFVAGSRTYPRLFGLIHAQHAERQGMARWGEQAALVERLAEVVIDAFPDARIVHLVRDPRDRLAEVIAEDGGRHRGGVGVATAMWLASVQLGERNLARHPKQYRLLRYETLLGEPEATLGELCAFIGEPYAPTMGDQLPAPESAGIGRFRSVLSPTEIAFMQARAGSAMRRLGYACDLVELSAAARLGYIGLRAPLHFAQMIAWRIRERAYDRLPAGLLPSRGGPKVSLEGI